MRREHNPAATSLRNRPGRYDTVFVNTGSYTDCMCSLDLAHLQPLSSSSHHCGVEYPCALVRWFSHVGDLPDDHTGMWVVQPDVDGSPPFIIHLDSIACAAHLPVPITAKHAKVHRPFYGLFKFGQS